MSAATYNLTIDQGATYQLMITLEDDTGARIDLTGYSFAGEIKALITDVTPLASFSFTIQNQAVPATKGQVLAYIPDTQTALIPVQNTNGGKCRGTSCYLYDITGTDSGGTVSRLLQGNAEVSQGVTT